MDHLLWTCPHCRQTFAVQSEQYEHTCTATAKECHYFFRLKDDHIVDALVLVGGVAADPLLAVETLAPDGTAERWTMKKESGRLVFYPPDGYAGLQGLVLRHSKEIQRPRPAPRDVMEREALSGRVSIPA